LRRAITLGFMALAWDSRPEQWYRTRVK